MRWEYETPGRLARVLERETGVEVEVHAPLAPLTSWKVGGDADLLVRPCGLKSAEQLFAFLHLHHLPWVVLGRGSNVLVPDAGIRAVVAQLNHLDRIERIGSGTYTVGAGTMLPKLVHECSRNGDSGLEDLAAIPGSVGGAVVMNAGAGSQCFAEVINSIRVVQDGVIRNLDRAQLDFGYRSSNVSAGMCVLEVTLQLHQTSAQLCMERRNAALEYRKQAQKTWMPNAGSVFRNPPDASAWKLIDGCGLRGFSIGGAQISPEHTNFIINTGTASAAEIKALIDHVQREVYRRYNIKLKPEIRLLSEELSRYEA
ncbi:MAG: UDP-N-acetylmuramate dehydrogenase [Desulfuromonadaceae bacterium]